MTKEEIAQYIGEIKAVMKITVSMDNPNGVWEKLNSLTNVLGLSAEIVAQASRIYNNKVGIVMKGLKEYSASDKKLMLLSLCSDEIYTHEEAANINKEVHYMVDSLRSMLSYIKSEISAFKH